MFQEKISAQASEQLSAFSSGLKVSCLCPFYSSNQVELHIWGLPPATVAWRSAFLEGFSRRLALQ